MDLIKLLIIIMKFNIIEYIVRDYCFAWLYDLIKQSYEKKKSLFFTFTRIILLQSISIFIKFEIKRTYKNQLIKINTRKTKQKRQMNSFKSVLIATALSLAIVISIYNRQETKTASYPVDSQGRKIRLGGIPWEFSNCGSENDPLIITSIVFSSQPERAAPPNDATLTGTFMVHEDLKALNVIVKLSGVQVFNNNLAALGTYDPGDMFTFPYTFQIPGIAPGGSYTLDLKFLNKQGTEISCTHLSMEL
ncbi:hypothetical protein ABPG74_022645 [Tetrahymena malaccensis]